MKGLKGLKGMEGIKYDFEKTIDRRGTHALKLDAMPKGCPEDALSAWVADMDLPCAEPIIEALHRRVDRQIFGYTIYHNEECKGAVRSWYRRRFGWEIGEKELFFSPGVVPALAMLINALTEEGDGIVIQKPVYYPFEAKIEANGRRVVNCPLKLREGDVSRPGCQDGFRLGPQAPCQSATELRAGCQDSRRLGTELRAGCQDSRRHGTELRAGCQDSRRPGLQEPCQPWGEGQPGPQELCQSELRADPLEAEVLGEGPQELCQPWGEGQPGTQELCQLGQRSQLGASGGAVADFDYVMDYDALEKALSDPSNKGMILCNPHNPVGRVWQEEELRRVLEIGRKYDKWIIADEIHGDLTRKGVTYTPLLKLADQMASEEAATEEAATEESDASATDDTSLTFSRYRNRIISCTAPSKTFNLAGLSMSNLIIPGRVFQKKWREVLEDRLSLGLCNPLSMEAMIAAYEKGEEWLEQLREYLDGNIAYVTDFVHNRLPKARVADCQGTYLMWLDFRGYIAGSEGDSQEDARTTGNLPARSDLPEGAVKKLELAMQQQGKVALDEGYIFGREGEGFERLNVAMPRSMVEEMMERIAVAAEWLERQK